MAVLLIPPFQYFTDDDGNPLSGGKVFTYQAGTTTPKAVYSAADGLTPLSNPVILDASGRTLMFGIGSYKFVVTDSNNVVIRTTDNVSTYTTTTGDADPFFQSFSGNGSTTSFTLTNNLGTDEKALLVFVNNDSRPYVTNGGFATDSDWTKGSGWTIGSGVATATGAISTAISQTTPVALVAGKSYSVTYTITRSAGGLIPSLGGQNGTERTASGTYREIIIAGSSQTLAFTGNAFTGTLDDVQIVVADGAGFEIQNINQYTVNGTSLSIAAAPANGTNNIMVFAPSLSVGVAQAAASAADASATAAAASASTASTAATTATAAAATATAAAYFGTSTTSNIIGAGAKSFTTQTGKNFQVGGFLLITDTASAANFMHGQVTSYDSGTGALVMSITNTGGSGTLASWNIYVSGTRGATGPAGGPLVDGSYGDVTVSGSGTVISINAGAVTSADIADKAVNGQFLNRAINGGMRIAQTKASTTTTQTNAYSYVADQWYGGSGASTTSSITRVTATGARSNTALAVSRQAGNTGTARILLYQPFDLYDSFDLAGIPCVLRFQAQRGAGFSGSGNILRSRIMTSTSTNQSAASMVAETWAGFASNNQNNVLTASYQEFSHFFTIPAGTQQIAIGFDYTPTGTAAAGDEFFVTSCYFGPSFGFFFNEPLPVEILRCQRYYQKSFAIDTVPVQNGGNPGMLTLGQFVGPSTQQTTAGARFVTPMRVSPTLTFFNPGAANAQARNLSTGGDCSGTTNFTLNDTEFSVTTTTGGGSSAGQIIAVHYAADARL